MNCNTAQTLMSAYVDDELSGSELLRVKRHLCDCPACQREETELRMLKDLLTSTPDIEPPVGFEDRLCEAIFSPKPSETAQWVGSWPFVSGVALVTAALTLLIISHLDATQQVTSQHPDSVVIHERVRDQAQDASNPFMDPSPAITASYEGK